MKKRASERGRNDLGLLVLLFFLNPFIIMSFQNCSIVQWAKPVIVGKSNIQKDQRAPSSIEKCGRKDSDKCMTP